MSTVSQWQKEAAKYAQKEANKVVKNNQQVIDQLNDAKSAALNLIDSQQNNAIYNLNTNKSSINQSAEAAAKQANVARLLSLKSNEQAMNRAGLGTQGIVGSQVNSINSNYGTNVNTILQNKINSLNDLETQKVNTINNYNENRVATNSDYDNQIAAAQSEIDAQARDQYNLAYERYMAQKQQEWENARTSNVGSSGSSSTSVTFNDGNTSKANSTSTSNSTNESKTYKSSYTPIFDRPGSERNNQVTNWYNNNIYKYTTSGITAAELESILSKGVSSGQITYNDADKILTSFGL